MQFITEVEIGEHLGDEGRGQVSINDRPFILEWITHQIVPAELDQSQNVSGWFYQDGLYQLDWSLYEQARFWKGVPPMADAGFGSIRDGTWKKLPAPVSLPGNETLHCRIINRVERPAK
ncbi:MAG: hypothetical protein GTO40_13025, partial [Deltaproteobacteria bacterium]|nr:hypothetical protein [Deltaproteobacteria bacterium]